MLNYIQYERKELFKTGAILLIDKVSNQHTENGTTLNYFKVTDGSWTNITLPKALFMVKIDP